MRSFSSNRVSDSLYSSIVLFIMNNPSAAFLRLLSLLLLDVILFDLCRYASRSFVHIVIEDVNASKSAHHFMSSSLRPTGNLSEYSSIRECLTILFQEQALYILSCEYTFIGRSSGIFLKKLFEKVFVAW